MKKKAIYICQECGHQTPKWLGKCPDCNRWNTLVEELVASQKLQRKNVSAQAPIRLKDVSGDDEERAQCGIDELDRVLGGGIVSGSFMLIGGDPGIGKSTLLLQCAMRLAFSGKVLYVSAEESSRQVRIRAQRLGTTPEELYIMAETSLEAVMGQVEHLKPAFLIVDSIQTIYTETLDSAPGSVSQVRECAGQLMQFAKKNGLPTFIVGHVTKDGSIAGPRMLEHMVDTVLYFEGEQGQNYRILRAVKNRFGSTNEIGVFEMKENGLNEVVNPSEIFLAERPEGASGSVVVSSLEGTRPILVELQALVSGSSFGTPRRTTIGFDHNRVSLLVAVLEKKAGLSLLSQDVFINVAGGVRLDEPASDLGVVAALASSHLNRSVYSQTVLFGEVGLAGEIRAVTRPELRVREAKRLGFDRCIIPSGNRKSVDELAGMQIVGVGTVQEALEALFD